MKGFVEEEVGVGEVESLEGWRGLEYYLDVSYWTHQTINYAVHDEALFGFSEGRGRDVDLGAW